MGDFEGKYELIFIIFRETIETNLRQKKHKDEREGGKEGENYFVKD